MSLPLLATGLESVETALTVAALVGMHVCALAVGRGHIVADCWTRLTVTRLATGHD